jgi:hypothetical protein
MVIIVTSNMYFAKSFHSRFLQIRPNFYNLFKMHFLEEKKLIAKSLYSLAWYGR